MSTSTSISTRISTRTSTMKSTSTSTSIQACFLLMTSMTLVEGNKIEMVQKKAFAIILGRNYHSYASALSSEVEKVAKPANLVGKKLAQVACVRHACFRAPCLAWPLLSPSFSLSLSLSFSPFFAFDPFRGISHVRNNFTPNILA